MQGAKFVENGEPGRKFFCVFWRGGRLGMGQRAWGALCSGDSPSPRGNRPSLDGSAKLRDGLLFHRMYKKTPEGVFYRMFSDVITGDTLAGKAFYAKK